MHRALQAKRWFAGPEHAPTGPRTDEQAMTTRSFEFVYIIEKTTGQVLAQQGPGTFVLSNHDRPDQPGLQLGERALLRYHAEGLPVQSVHVFQRITGTGEPVLSDPKDPTHAFVPSDQQIQIGQMLEFFDDFPIHRSARQPGRKRFG